MIHGWAMPLINEMQYKILAAFAAIGRECAVDWVEVSDGDRCGVIWLQRAGGFQTLLRLEYEFQTRFCRLLLVRHGKQVAGRCVIRYDDSALIEQVLGQFRALVNDPGSRASHVIESRGDSNGALDAQAPSSCPEWGRHWGLSRWRQLS